MKTRATDKRARFDSGSLSRIWGSIFMWKLGTLPGSDNDE